MSLERAAMRGRLAEAEQEQVRLRMRIEGAARVIRQGLNTTLYMVDALEIPMLDEQFDIIKSSWAEHRMLSEQIERLKRELK